VAENSESVPGGAGGMGQGTEGQHGNVRFVMLCLAPYTCLPALFATCLPALVLLRPRYYCCTALHCTALHRTALHCTALHCTVLYCRYSEELEMGYRWFDAHQETPLFPFGAGERSQQHTPRHITSHAAPRHAPPRQTGAFRSRSHTRRYRSCVRAAAGTAGLSYTSWEWSGLTVQPTSVSCTLKNAGKRTGSTVAQLYLGFPAEAGEPPRLLKGFVKVELAPGANAIRKVLSMIFYTSKVHPQEKCRLPNQRDQAEDQRSTTNRTKRKHLSLIQIRMCGTDRGFEAGRV
jgi:hypothetical protein